MTHDQDDRYRDMKTVRLRNLIERRLKDHTKYEAGLIREAARRTKNLDLVQSLRDHPAEFVMKLKPATAQILVERLEDIIVATEVKAS